ncbi:hypothetical protein ACJZ2D_003836 [Fusarium nematophilum]
MVNGLATTTAYGSRRQAPRASWLLVPGAPCGLDFQPRWCLPPPAESASSITTKGTKRKDHKFGSEAGVAADEGTNITVVVRCRGRNEREVKQNSAAVVQTDGVKGKLKLIQLLMGPSVLRHRTCDFYRVFSPAADQRLIFDDVVKPILFWAR